MTLKNHSKIWIIFLSGFLFSCSGTKVLQENESLVNANIIEFSDSLNVISSLKKAEKAELSPALIELALQKPNKKFLFLFKSRLAFYNLAENPERKKKRIEKNKPIEKGLAFWVKEKLGEPPVIYDSVLTANSVERMKNFLVNQGYFKAFVSVNAETERKKTAITYLAAPGDRYKFNDLHLEIEDSVLKQYIMNDIANSLIVKGEPYTVDALKGEQDRIANYLNNHGFFSFTKNLINFEIDTGTSGLQKDVYMIVKNDSLQLGEIMYFDGNINFTVTYKNTTLKRRKLNSDTLRGINFYYSKLDMYPDILVRSIFYVPNDTFRKDNYFKTINRLNELGIFRFVNIKYKPLMVSESEGYVDTDIVAEVRKNQSGKISLEANTDARNLIGMFVNLSYAHKNLFKRADRLQLNVSNGIEFRMNTSNVQNVTDSRINSLNLLASARLYFPKLFPQGMKKIKAANYPPQLYPKNTFFDLSYNLQRRLGFYTYSVNTFNISYGYEIKAKNIKHEIIPIRISFIKPREESFNNNFNEFLSNNPIFALSYRQQFIMGQEYTYTYNSQDIYVGAFKSIVFFRGSVNTAGNIVYGIQKAIRGKQDTPYTLAKIPYATYTRVDGDFRYYINFGRNSTLVSRLFAGSGFSYFNSDVMPFVKQYSAGGPQSMRGWDYRSLGPGSLDTSLTSVNLNTGDVQLELNLEFRFSVTKTLKAALFSDAGNVWLMREQEGKPNAHFDVKRLGQDLAWDAGFGVRLDFGLFIVRFDNAYKLYNPNLREGQRWINQYPGFDVLNNTAENPGIKDGWWQRWGTWRRNYANFVIGIGYPF